MKHSSKLRNHLLSGKKTMKGRAEFLLHKYGRPALGAAFQAALVLGIYALPALAQGTMPNPFGGSGTTKLANAGSNVMVIGTWLAFFVGLLSFVLIPIFIKFEWNYKKLIMSGLTGLGGFIILGGIAYDIVNLGSVNMPDPTIGH